MVLHFNVDLLTTICKPVTAQTEYCTNFYIFLLINILLLTFLLLQQSKNKNKNKISIFPQLTVTMIIFSVLTWILTRIVVTYCRLQETLGVFRVERCTNFYTGTVCVPRRIVLWVLGGHTSCSAIWTTKHDWHVILTSAHKYGKEFNSCNITYSRHVIQIQKLIKVSVVRWLLPCYVQLLLQRF